MERWGVEAGRAEQERILLADMGVSDAAFQVASLEEKRVMVSSMRTKCEMEYFRSYSCELCLRYNVQLAEDRSSSASRAALGSDAMLSRL